MIRIDLDYYYTFGRAMARLEQCFDITPCDLDSRDVARISNAVQWLIPIANGDYPIVRALKDSADGLLRMLKPLLEIKAMPTHVPSTLHAKIHQAITSFHNELRKEAKEIYTFFIPGIGAYSASALLEDASCHLSEEAQKELHDTERADFKLAGGCLACTLHTATGFHAMRALEAEARRYHKVVTSAPIEVDWTLDPLINGNSGRGQFGLRDQWKKEGAKNDSPLSLIISLLSSITQIYRNPIMHPEMVLDKETAKQVFDTAALVISAMVKDRKLRTP